LAAYDLAAHASRARQRLIFKKKGRLAAQEADGTRAQWLTAKDVLLTAAKGEGVSESELKPHVEKLDRQEFARRDAAARAAQRRRVEGARVSQQTVARWRSMH
jgi:hypothetical protein